jgi:hypothetical protein
MLAVWRHFTTFATIAQRVGFALAISTRWE